MNIGKSPAAVSLASALMFSVDASFAQQGGTLRDELAAQRALIDQQRQVLQQQQEQLECQGEELRRLSGRLSEVEAGEAIVSAPADAANVRAPAGRQSAQAGPGPVRDSVGDLNAGAVRSGEFPGSIRIPGSRDLSLAIGGFVKTAALWDTDAEQIGSDFLPSTLGLARDSTGNVSLDSTLTRLNLDARAPTRNDGLLRGYIESDLNANNDGTLQPKLRLAFGSWTTARGTLTAGQNWSTLMDTRILPESVTEPTVSGAIFVRQSQLRWSQELSQRWTYHVAIEDPSSGDLETDLANVAFGASIPDVIAGLEYDEPRWHFRLSGIVRRLQFDTRTASAMKSADGVSPRRNQRAVNWGAFVTYQHHWSDVLRSSAMIGHARADALDGQPGLTFESTTYGAQGLTWSSLRRRHAGRTPMEQHTYICMERICMERREQRMLKGIPIVRFRTEFHP